MPSAEPRVVVTATTPREPTPVGLEQTRQLLAERLRSVDAMRLAVFGRTR